MRNIRLPPLSRGGKILRNLAVTALLLWLLWGKQGYPMPTAELAFRRAEHANMAGPSRIQWVGKKEVWGVVGTCQDQVLIQTGNDYLRWWPRNLDGPTLVPLNQMILAVDPPEGTVSARLELETEFYYFPQFSDSDSLGPLYAGPERAAADYPKNGPAEYRSFSCSAAGELLKWGSIRFVPQGEEPWAETVLLNAMEWYTYHDVLWDRSVQVRMEAVFYGPEGQELGRAALRTQSLE